MHYTTLNCVIRKAIDRNVSPHHLRGGHGSALHRRHSHRRRTSTSCIHGTPGNNLGAFLNGPTIEVFGNAQDMTGNTMNSGKIIVHGNAWDVTGLSARGGKIMIKGSLRLPRRDPHEGVRQDDGPVWSSAGPPRTIWASTWPAEPYWCWASERAESPVGHNIGAGMHGGRIYVRGKVDISQLGPGAVVSQVTEEDTAELTSLIEEFEGYFGEPGRKGLLQFREDQALIVQAVQRILR